MQEPSPLQELISAVSDCETSILYQPIKDELDYINTQFPLQLKSRKVVLPCNKNADPFLWFNRCQEVCENSIPYILIPGTKFDIHGTRQGKGGGWYDRFLSKTPRAWLKIGIADQSQVSFLPLTRKSWDVPVDWLLIFSKNNWSAVKIQKMAEDL